MTAVRVKTQIYITRQLVAAVLFLLIGGVCTLYGLRSLYRESRCIALEDLSADNYREGAYVAGMIESCATITVQGKELGVPVSFIAMGGTRECYTIPMADSRYTRIMVIDQDTIDGIEQVIDKTGKGIYVEGEITKEMTEPNYRWYEQCEQIGDPREDVVNGYEIREISFGKRRSVLVLGVEIVLLTVFALWKGNILSNAYDSESEVLSGQAAYRQKNYDIAGCIMAEERKINLLQGRIAEYKKSCMYGIFTLPAGGYFVFHSYFLLMWLAGLVMIAYSLKVMLRYLLHSGHDWTDRIMHFAGKKSLGEQIEESYDTIAVLKSQIDKERKRQNEKTDFTGSGLPFDTGGNFVRLRKQSDTGGVPVGREQ